MAHVKISNLTGSSTYFAAMLLLQVMKYYQEKSFLGQKNKMATIFPTFFFDHLATEILLKETQTRYF